MSNYRAEKWNHRHNIPTINQVVRNLSSTTHNIKTNIQQNTTNIHQNAGYQTELKEHLEISDNTFSIDNVNTISNSFTDAIKKLNLHAKMFF